MCRHRRVDSTSQRVRPVKPRAKAVPVCPFVVVLDNTSHLALSVVPIVDAWRDGGGSGRQSSRREHFQLKKLGLAWVSFPNKQLGILFPFLRLVWRETLTQSVSSALQIRSDSTPENLFLRPVSIEKGGAINISQVQSLGKPPSCSHVSTSVIRRERRKATRISSAARFLSGDPIERTDDAGRSAERRQYTCFASEGSSRVFGGGGGQYLRSRRRTSTRFSRVYWRSLGSNGQQQQQRQQQRRQQQRRPQS